MKLNYLPQSWLGNRCEDECKILDLYQFYSTAIYDDPIPAVIPLKSFKPLFLFQVLRAYFCDSNMGQMNKVIYQYFFRLLLIRLAA